jgi:hypothetical protein
MPQERYFKHCKSIDQAKRRRRVLAKEGHSDLKGGIGSSDASDEFMKEVNSQYDQFVHDFESQKRNQQNPNTVMGKFAMILAYANQIGTVEKQNGNIIITIDSAKMMGYNPMIDLAIMGIMNTIKNK